jgi:hypothetical protein
MLNTTFKIRDLSVLAYANGFTMWHYKTSNATYVMVANFFKDAQDMLSVGDMIIITGESVAKILVVAETKDSVIVASFS